MANTYMDKHSTSLASVICKQNSYHQQNKNKGPTGWCMSIFQAMQEVEKGRRQLTDKNIRETHLNKQTGCGGYNCNPRYEHGDRRIMVQSLSQVSPRLQTN
jgi:hypothetical protein